VTILSNERQIKARRVPDRRCGRCAGELNFGTMIKNTNDGTQNAPYLRCDINMGNLEALPDFSSAPSGDARAVLAGIKAAGFSGVQGCDAQLCREIGLRRTGSGRVNKLGEVDAIAANGAADGVDCVTLHVAWGIEDDAEVFALVEEILRASERHAIPLYIETHRATIAQDMWRTLQIVKRFPEVRFNGDFSHWYTGQEMVYGGFENKFDFIATVLERVRFIHGRIGNPGCIQVGIKNDGTETFIEFAGTELETHHTVPISLQRRLGLDTIFGPGIFDECPGFLTTMRNHRMKTGVDGKAIESIHDYINKAIQPGATKEQILDGLKDAYDKAKMPDVWKVTEQWLASKGVVR